MRTAVFETNLLPNGYLECPEEFSDIENARYQVIVTFDETAEEATQGLPTGTVEGKDGEMLRIETEIDRLYDEIRELAERPMQAGLEADIARKRDELRKLQEQEAGLMEERADAGLRFDPADGKRLLERASGLLET